MKILRWIDRLTRWINPDYGVALRWEEPYLVIHKARRAVNTCEFLVDASLIDPIKDMGFRTVSTSGNVPSHDAIKMLERYPYLRVKQ